MDRFFRDGRSLKPQGQLEELRLPPRRIRLQRLSLPKRRRKPRHRGLSRPHQTLLLRSAPEIRPPPPLTAGDGFRTRLLGRTTPRRGIGRAQVGDPLQDWGEQLPRGNLADRPGKAIPGKHFGKKRCKETFKIAKDS